jgi:hypothetical protein
MSNLRPAQDESRHAWVASQCNQHLFAKENFSARVLGRPHSDFEPLDLQQLEKDMDYVTRRTNPTVNRLIEIRHNYYSHRNASDVIEDRRISEAYPHQRDEVGELLKNGLTIVNRYTGLFDSNYWSQNISGREDFQYVLRAIKEKMERQRG